MGPPTISQSLCSGYSLAEIWPFPVKGSGGLEMRMGGDMSIFESTVTENSHGNGGRKRRDGNSEQLLSTSSVKDNLNNFNGKRRKLSESRDKNGGSKSEVETISEQSIKAPKPPKQDYIHVRARRGQATDSHSLAERARREKISERMKLLQDLVPGCNKVTGKALVLDEIINYVQSLQRQVEFLSMKLEAVSSRMSSPIEGFSSKDLGVSTFDATEILYGSQAAREYMQASQTEWLHMQLGSTF